MNSFTIQGVDNEFAVSTGDNVGVGENSSTFDNPPNGSKDLLITTKDGDPDPRLFEIGDIYEVAWGGQGGGGVITDAAVVRSDAAPGDGGIIVFEGLDSDGNVAQVIWTPDFDLEGWYADNYNPSAEPQFYTNDTQPDYSHSFVCFVSDTLIATPHGERRASTLRAGDVITTRDTVDMPLTWVGSRICPGQGTGAPVVFAPGSIGNRRPLRVSQMHRVLLRSPMAELYFGAPDVLVPAKACVDGVDVTLEPRGCVGYVHLLLAKHCVVFAEGAPCESLLLTDRSMRMAGLDAVLPRMAQAAGAGPRHNRAAHLLLTVREGRALWHLMRADRRGRTNVA